MKLKTDTEWTFPSNGVDVTLAKGTTIEIAADDTDTAAQLCNAGKIPVNLDHEAGGKSIRYGAGGKRFEYAIEPVKKEEPKKEEPKKEETKAEAPKKEKTTKAAALAKAEKEEKPKKAKK